MQHPVGHRVVPGSDEDGVPLSDGDREVVDSVRSELDLEREGRERLVSLVGVVRSCIARGGKVDELHQPR